MKTENMPRVVIVGAGFGGLETAQKLAHTPVQITLVDRHNYHLFQPLLYQIAIAGLVPSQIAYPLRTIFRHQKNLTFQMGEVTSVDFDERYIRLNGSVIGYDYLVLALGGQTNFFGMKAVEENGFQLKSIEDATGTRNHLLKVFEQANREVDPDKRRALMTFVVVGGGPTGVETAGALAELIRHVLAKDYPEMDLSEVRVLLIEATGSVMATYPDELRKATMKLLESKGVEIFLNTRLTDYNGRTVTAVDGSQIEAYTLIWTAGVRSAEFTDHLGVPQGPGDECESTQRYSCLNTPRFLSSAMRRTWRMERGNHYRCWQPLPNRKPKSQQRTSKTSSKEKTWSRSSIKTRGCWRPLDGMRPWPASGDFPSADLLPG